MNSIKFWKIVAFNFFVLVFIFGNGCQRNLDRLYFKVIETPELRIEWFKVSSIGTEPTEYVIMSTSKGTDTLAHVNTIHDVQVDLKGRVLLSFYGRPKLYGDEILIPDNFLGIEVVQNFNIDLQYEKSYETFKKDRWN